MTTCTLAFDDTDAAYSEDVQRFEKTHRPKRWSLNSPVKRALQEHRRSISFTRTTKPAAHGGFNRRNIKKLHFGLD